MQSPVGCVSYIAICYRTFDCICGNACDVSYRATQDEPSPRLVVRGRLHHSLLDAAYNHWPEVTCVMDLNDELRLYDDHVIRHFDEPYHRGLWPKASHRERKDNPVCGDSISIELEIDASGIIKEPWFTGSGCIISQAAASMLVEYIEGRSLDEIRAFTAQNMLGLFRAPLTPRRQQCCLLAWQCLKVAIESPVSAHD